MQEERRPDEISYRGHTCTIEMLGWWCTQCDEAIFSGEALVEREKVFLALKDRVADQSPSPHSY